MILTLPESSSSLTSASWVAETKVFIDGCQRMPTVYGPSWSASSRPRRWPGRACRRGDSRLGPLRQRREGTIRVLGCLGRK